MIAQIIFGTTSPELVLGSAVAYYCFKNSFPKLAKVFIFFAGLVLFILLFGYFKFFCSWEIIGRMFTIIFIDIPTVAFKLTRLIFGF